MRIQLLVIEDCPNSAVASNRLETALELLGIGGVLVEHRVMKTCADVRGTEFAGSPTIAVDSLDLFPGAPTEELSCRVYSTPLGLQGAPTIEQLTAAFASRGLGKR
ncbi:thioredoxin family protein [Glutamicibacter sp.]|uniref:thioredoxin family protein n=1 Tax=Glutamicibacter sp. TaxID=1931995 RepID=UPI002B496981|nr:thioredoxin family protein [Glutamicibacter sp.]HJX78612.1 thioredoxin family protein [Glutamicibacter sp.]